MGESCNDKKTRKCEEKRSTFVFNKQRLAGCVASVIASKSLETPAMSEEAYTPIMEPISLSGTTDQDGDCEQNEFSFCISSVRGEAEDLDPFLSDAEDLDHLRLDSEQTDPIIAEPLKEVVNEPRECEKAAKSCNRESIERMIDVLKQLDDVTVPDDVIVAAKPKLPETLSSDEEQKADKYEKSVSEENTKKSPPKNRKQSPRKSPVVGSVNRNKRLREYKRSPVKRSKSLKDRPGCSVENTNGHVQSKSGIGRSRNSSNSSIIRNVEDPVGSLITDFEDSVGSPISNFENLIKIVEDSIQNVEDPVGSPIRNVETPTENFNELIGSPIRNVETPTENFNELIGSPIRNVETPTENFEDEVLSSIRNAKDNVKNSTETFKDTISGTTVESKQENDELNENVQTNVFCNTNESCSSNSDIEISINKTSNPRLQIGLFGSSKVTKTFSNKNIIMATNCEKSEAVTLNYKSGTSSSSSDKGSESETSDQENSISTESEVNSDRSETKKFKVVLAPAKLTLPSTSQNGGRNSERSNRRKEKNKWKNYKRKKSGEKSSDMLSAIEEEAQKKRLAQEIPSHNWLENKIRSGDMSIKGPMRRSSTHLPIFAPPQRTVNSTRPVAVASRLKPQQQPASIMLSNDNVCTTTSSSVNRLSEESKPNEIKKVEKSSTFSWRMKTIENTQPNEENKLVSINSKTNALTDTSKKEENKNKKNLNILRPAKLNIPLNKEQICQPLANIQVNISTDLHDRQLEAGLSCNFTLNDRRLVEDKVEESSTKIENVEKRNKIDEDSSSSDDVMIINEDQDTHVDEMDKNVVAEPPVVEEKKCINRRESTSLAELMEITSKRPSVTADEVLENQEQVEAEIEKLKFEIDAIEKVEREQDDEREYILRMKRDKELLLSLMERYSKNNQLLEDKKRSSLSTCTSTKKKAKIEYERKGDLTLSLQLPNTCATVAPSLGASNDYSVPQVKTMNQTEIAYAIQKEQNRKQYELEQQQKQQRELEQQRKQQFELEQQRKQQFELEQQRKQQFELEQQRRQQFELEQQRRQQIELEHRHKQQIELEQQRRQQLEFEQRSRHLQAQQQHQQQLILNSMIPSPYPNTSSATSHQAHAPIRPHYAPPPNRPTVATTAPMHHTTTTTPNQSSPNHRIAPTYHQSSPLHHAAATSYQSPPMQHPLTTTHHVPLPNTCRSSPMFGIVQSPVMAGSNLNRPHVSSPLVALETMQSHENVNRRVSPPAYNIAQNDHMNSHQMPAQNRPVSTQLPNQNSPMIQRVQHTVPSRAHSAYPNPNYHVPTRSHQMSSPHQSQIIRVDALNANCVNGGHLLNHHAASEQLGQNNNMSCHLPNTNSNLSNVNANRSFAGSSSSNPHQQMWHQQQPLPHYPVPTYPQQHNNHHHNQQPQQHHNQHHVALPPAYSNAKQPVPNEESTPVTNNNDSTPQSESGSVSEVEEIICFHCLKKATSICSMCKSVSYCSVQCQEADWVEHEKMCQSISRENK